MFNLITYPRLLDVIEELIGPEKFQAWVDSLRPGPDLPRNCKSKNIEELGVEEILARWREIARVYTNSMRLLEENNGYLPYNDKSSPEEIYAFFGMSKKTFKMTTGNLYKSRKILFTQTGIKMAEES